MAAKFLNSIKLLTIFVLFNCLLIGQSQAKNDPSTVTIPLKDYLSLIKDDKKELQFSTVENVKVTGNYGKDLNIIFNGSSSANPLQVTVMDYNNQFSISTCKGDAALSLEKTNVVLFPQAKRFKVSCVLKINDWQNLKFNFKKILSVNLDVKGAEAIYQPGSVGEKKFSIFPKDRQVASTNEPPSFVTRYHLSLLKDETRFKYYFRVDNPNKKAQDFVFEPRKSEVVKQVQSSLRYNEKKGSYHFVLPPGTSQFMVEGRLNQENWTAPIDSGLSYLLIDQHPMITSKVNTEAKRVSKNTIGIPGRFPVAKAYILSKNDKFQWEKSELEAFTATTYTIDQANYDYFWSKSGQDLVEVTYTINNQGANEIPLKIPGTPTYLAINHRAQVLTKTKNDELLLNIPTGENQQVTVQYKVDQSQPRFLASLSSNLPKPDTTISSSNIALQLPKSHQPLFFKNGDDWQFYLGFPRIFQAALLFLLFSFFLKKAKVESKTALGVAGGFALLNLYFHSLFTWTVFLVIVSFFLAYRDRFDIKQNFTPKKIILGFGSLCLLMIVWVGLKTTVPSFQSYTPRTSQVNALGASYSGIGGAGSSGARMKKRASKGFAPASVQTREDMDMAENEMVSVSSLKEYKSETDNYQGLPAKIQIPSEGRRIYLKQGFTEAKRGLAFVAWSFNSWILKGINYSILFLCLFALWREREKFLVFTNLNKTLKR